MRFVIGLILVIATMTACSTTPPQAGGVVASQRTPTLVTSERPSPPAVPPASAPSGSAAQVATPDTDPVAVPTYQGMETAMAQSTPSVFHRAPRSITIPAIGVKSSIIDLGLNPDGTLEVPQDYDETGWWAGGSRQLEVGPTVIVGHVDSTTGPAVFWRLRELTPGDIIEVTDDAGVITRFAVRRVTQYEKDEFPTDLVYGPTERPTLRLITCGGEYDRDVRSYRANTVVYAEWVDEEIEAFTELAQTLLP